MLEEIRMYFNVKIISVAKYTGASTHNLKSLSVKRRVYNITLLNKLLPLYKALTLKKRVEELPYVKSVLKTEQEQAIPYLQELIKKLEKEINNKEKLLKHIQEKRKHWLRGLHACTILLQNENGTLTKENIEWLVLRKKHLQQKLTELSFYDEVLLIAKIKGLKKEVKMIQKTINISITI